MIIKTDPDIIKNYFEDTSNLKGGHAEEVAMPQDESELSSFVREANIRKMAVTISGGGTGTTGARIPFGGAIVSTEKLNRISDISERAMSVTAQAGAFVDDIKSGAEKHGLFYTSHPTERTATVGGTVATNASGSRSFKYGPTRKYVKRLKMVLASGEILDISRGKQFLTRDNSSITLPLGTQITIPLPTYKMPGIKNAAGYFARDGMDLIDLFIGQEGTLSIITEVEFGLVKKPYGILSCFVFFREESDAWRFSIEARSLLRKKIALRRTDFDILSLEYFDSNALRLLSKKNSNIPAGMSAAIFFEQELHEKMKESFPEDWVDLISAHNASLDNTWVAMNEKDAGRFTEFRHSIPESVNEIVRKNGFRKFSTDIAVPDQNFLEMMNFYADVFKKSGLDYIIFGHIGESHVHVNILPRSEPELEKAKQVSLTFVKKGILLGGTVSAEHGIGKIKHKYLEEMYGKSAVLEMARIKKALDPNCILGLDNIFSKEILRLA